MNSTSDSTPEETDDGIPRGGIPLGISPSAEKLRVMAQKAAIRARVKRQKNDELSELHHIQEGSALQIPNSVDPGDATYFT